MGFKGSQEKNGVWWPNAQGNIPHHEEQRVKM